jgi:hypothetical protein
LARNARKVQILLLRLVHLRADNIIRNSKENYAMSWQPEISEPSYQEMSEMLFRKNPVTERRRRRKAILALVIGILAVMAFRKAWDHGIITYVAVSVWNILCRVVADWKFFLQAALR